MHRLQEVGRETIVLRQKQTSAFLLIAFATVFIDQFTKWLVIRSLEPGERVNVVGDLFGLVLVRNPGGAFGLFPSATLFFVLASLAIVIVVVLWWTRRRENPVSLGLILGGGLGNLIDRMVQPPGFFRGHVVDFLDLPFWPTFNLADTAIVAGVLLLLAGGISSRQKP